MKWSDADVATVRQRYPHESTAAVARDLGRPVGQVYQMAARLGLLKSDEYLASPAACRLRRGDNTGAAHRFTKGQPAWNRGTKGVVGVQEGCRATQFKKGEMRGAAQHNYVPVGSERISKDGYLERKVTDDHPVPARRWIGVHRIVWESANGPVPPGHAIAFLPGRRTTDARHITLDALELVSRAELMRRNTRHNYPPELNELLSLKAALTRKINNRTKEAE